MTTYEKNPMRKYKTLYIDTFTILSTQDLYQNNDEDFTGGLLWYIIKVVPYYKNNIKFYIEL